MSRGQACPPNPLHAEQAGLRDRTLPNPARSGRKQRSAKSSVRRREAWPLLFWSSPVCRFAGLVGQTSARLPSALHWC